jgi:Domain of unknown function (DU1801)
MADQKTKQTTQSVESFLSKVTDKQVREDCNTIIKLMKKVTGAPPKMWGPSIIGFGQYHYKYESGHEGDMCLTGFSPRKQNISLYIMAGIPGQDELMKKLGKHKAGKGCIYVKQLKDIDTGVLENMISKAVNYLKKKYQAK